MAFEPVKRIYLNIWEGATGLVLHLDWTEDVGVEAAVGRETDLAVLVSLGGRVVRLLTPTVRLVVVVVAGNARVENLPKRHRPLATLRQHCTVFLYNYTTFASD